MRKVIKHEVEPRTVSIDNIDRMKLYFRKNSHGVIYKLQSLAGNGWTFTNMTNSLTFTSGPYGDMREAIKHEMTHGDVYEFDTLEEAMREMLK